MDPDACLAEIRRLTKCINSDPDDMAVLGMAFALAELVDALDEWISKGGFLPNEWTKEGRRGN